MFFFGNKKKKKRREKAKKIRKGIIAEVPGTVEKEVLAMSQPKNLIELLSDTLEKHRDHTGFSYKSKDRWVDVTYGEFWERVNHLAGGLLNLGVEKGDKICLLSENRLDWAVTDYAILSLGAVDVPIYPTNTAKKVKYIIENSDAMGIICSTREQLAKIEKILPELDGIKFVVAMDLDTPMEGVHSLKEVIEDGKKTWEDNREKIEQKRSDVEGDDLATLIYTSGTTGKPKGVMLTHKNFVSNVLAITGLLPFDNDDRALSFLPLSHSFERCPGYYAIIHNGGQIAYAEGIDKVPQNMTEVRPTVMCSVPRLYEKMHTKIKENVQNSSWIKKALFNWSYRAGQAYHQSQYRGETPGLFTRIRFRVADKLVLSKIKERTGGNLRFFVSGGAPLAEDIMKFFYNVGILILEGYGLTETSPILTANLPDRLRFGTVGKAIGGVEIKIADDGEILARGPNIMKGYYNNEEATSEVIDDDGWFHTGDVGELDEGFLKITDRKKDLLITAGGKNVAPQNLENMFKTNRYIDQFVVVGDRRKYLSALVVPDYDLLAEYAKDQGIDFDSPQDLVTNSQVRDMVYREIESMQRELASYETIKKITLVPQPFSEATGELTPTLKVKRRTVRDKYSDEIDQMYHQE